MSTVKSFRMNEKTSKMFNVLKSYYSKVSTTKVTDSEIISYGIEELYVAISEELNSNFFSNMTKALKGYNPMVMNAFTKIYDLLDVYCAANGTIIQDEFHSFFFVSDGGSLYSVERDTGEQSRADSQFRRISDIVHKQFKNEEDLDESIEILRNEFSRLYEYKQK